MEQFYYETHLHTSEASDCGESPATEMVDYYKSLGFAGICVTDHFFNGNCAVSKQLPWEQRVELFCRGYEHARARGDEVGLSVFFGWEFNYRSTEVLTYGLDKQWLMKNPQIVEMELRDYCKYARSEGALIVQAHPFRRRNYIDMIRLLPDDVDAVEVFNAAHTGEHAIENDRALWYAQQFGLTMTAGSDIHRSDGIAGGGIITKKPLNSVDDFIKAVKSNDFELYRKPNN